MKEFFEKLLDSRPLTIIIVIGAIFIVLGAMGGIPVNTPVTVVDSTGRLILIIIGIILLAATLFILIIPSDAKTPIRNLYGVTVEKPKSATGDVVIVEGDFPIIFGHYKRKPPEGMLRLFLYDHANNIFWPQDEKFVVIEDNGEWHSKVHIGGKNWTVTLIVALAPPSGQAMCDYYFTMGRLSDGYRKDIGENTDQFQKYKSKLYWRHFDGNLPADFYIIAKQKIKRAT